MPDDVNEDVKHLPTATHWGAYTATVENGRVTALEPFSGDPDPSPIGPGMPQAQDDAVRIAQPMVRKGWLDSLKNGGPKKDVTGRGSDPFVALSWDEALDIVANELTRVKETHGNEAIYAGSYGWASAGRFHHAQSQMRRFLNLFGGNTYSVGTYSSGAAEVIVPHIAGTWADVCYSANTTWGTIADHSELVVAFGGLALKNSQVHGGGLGRHIARDALQRCKDNGVEIVNVSPISNDAADFLDATWLTPHPGTDVAVMLALAHTLATEDLHDPAFLETHCTGSEKVIAYILGRDDGVEKDAAWAAKISGLNAETIKELARTMAKRRTLVTVSWSMQRADHGEQTYWMALTLAAILGQIGLPGGGFGCAYAGAAGMGGPGTPVAPTHLPKGQNPVSTFIPVSRISDLLLNPGGTVRFNGQTLTYPDIRLVYWCGGNPFHHHQDLNRMLRAWQKPETIIVNEAWWNPMARHADIVLPVTTTLERNDVTASGLSLQIMAMHKAAEPFGEARNDHDIFKGVAERVGVAEAFTEGRTEMEWVRWLYQDTCSRAADIGINTPDFETFWAPDSGGMLEWPSNPERTMFEAFRDNPQKNPLATPSGRLELFSETIAGWNDPGQPGHAVWHEPSEWLGDDKARTFPLHLISNQPATRLHSQYDNGGYSQASKVQGREPVWINPDDASARGVEDGDIVRLFNDRGACLAGAVVTDQVRTGVLQLSTGAWYDPATPGEIGVDCVHGNPNVLTHDAGTSTIAQGTSAQTCLVQLEKFDGEAPPVRVFNPPEIQ
ncbi:MAG: molybdopterin-dependent oxidoreductase [Alphaproteobacteria bacterium]|nr:molybdopterin-dependent oxidoreductase [Alphaproteobacteria bacterium]